MTSKELEARTLQFAIAVRAFAKTLRARSSDIDQLVRASGSVGANYIEANAGLSRKDFLMRLRICRKEAREALYWLTLIESVQPTNRSPQLKREAEELSKIFTASILTIERSELLQS